MKMNHFLLSFTLFNAPREKYELLYLILTSATFRYAHWDESEIHLFTPYTEKNLELALSTVLGVSDQLKIVRVESVPVAHPPLNWQMGAVNNPQCAVQARKIMRDYIAAGILARRASSKNLRAA